MLVNHFMLRCRKPLISFGMRRSIERAADGA